MFATSSLPSPRIHVMLACVARCMIWLCDWSCALSTPYSSPQSIHHPFCLSTFMKPLKFLIFLLDCPSSNHPFRESLLFQHVCETYAIKTPHVNMAPTYKKTWLIRFFQIYLKLIRLFLDRQMLIS